MVLFLAAAGCEEQRYEEFQRERNDLECEIAMACGSEVAQWRCDQSVGELDKCEDFSRNKANRCIEQLQDQLDVAEGEGSRTDQLCEGQLPSPETCYTVTEWNSKKPGCASQTIDGRPLRDGDGAMVLPEMTVGDAWASVQPGTLGACAAAAEHWLHAARTEHASVPAFSRLAIELMALRAPPDLLRRAHEAGLDEIEHARLCLGLARQLGDEAYDFGALAVIPPRVDVTLTEIAIESLIEGCIGEGAAAARADAARRSCVGHIAEVLETIAHDELEHARLAWSIVAWAVRQDASIAPALRQALSEHRASLGSGHARPSIPTLGVLGDQDAADLERELIDDVVEPVLEQVLASPRTGRQLGMRAPSRCS